ncbi:VOC family protein [Planctomonas sp. JC2975]|uniref:VOC family protein n=1 Tax=Planctomonas sp. JC2975 TaxID=2729626 RepID=UPI001474DEDE|nr:VOC family protein [Planctomonas sp. JC2975]NNC14008.1 VOC family protein [Planctomonas sp. JC2975]
MELASIRIITHDVERLTAFYEHVTQRTATRPAPVFAEIRTDRATLAIGDVTTVGMLGAAAPAPGHPSGIIIEFLVDDVDDEFARLRPNPDDVALPPTTMPWGNRSAVFRDPDGNTVNLFTRPVVASPEPIVSHPSQG